MGSVVLDAVNSFFHQQHLFQDAPSARDATFPPPPSSSSSYRSASSPPRSETSMSTSAPRASSSSTAHTTPQSAPAPTENVARRASPQLQQQPTSSRTTSARPHSPPLAPNTGPPLDGTQASAVVMDDAPPEIRRTGPPKIKVRDLEHIQTFASEDMSAFSEIRSRSRSRSRGAETPQYEISEMKVEHIIEMVAGLLTKITTTNDQQHEHLHRQPPHLQATTTSPLSPQTTSVLAFHGKNVPSITILSYLSRINKYCPTSYEVFLSLLVYFDRMTERVNAGPMQSLRQANEAAAASASGASSSAAATAAGATERHQSISSTHSSNSSSSSSGSSATSEDMEGVTATTPQGTQTATPPASGNMQKADEPPNRPGTPHSRTYHQPDSPSQPTASLTDPYNLSHFFVVDSFNIHRLVIAGVTCASKFFSDIFYTNSRYAKVGGLPLPELNHLELQFLLLNDFRLSIPVEEIEAYGTMLVEFYAREVVAQQRAVADAEAERARVEAASAMQARSLSESSEDSVATVRAA